MTAQRPTDIRSAIRAASEFLLKSQDESGAWKDFLLPAGNSNVWVTAFVGDVLASRPEPEAQRAAQSGWRFLQQAATPDGGWSYNPTVPGDGDSTLWGLRLAETLGVEASDTARKAGEFLEKHIREDAGLTTYASPDPVRNYIGIPPVISFRGWTQSHTCVTAAGANLAAHRLRFRQYLIEKQAEDGSWPAYWWFDDEYSTAESVAALTGKNRTIEDCEPPVASAIERAAGWALGRAAKLAEAHGKHPPAFALAHALRVLVRAARRAETCEMLKAGLARIVEWQRGDGSWPASAKLRVPRPDILIPKPDADWTLWAGMPAGPPTMEAVLKHTFNNYSLDHYGVYTTATVLRSLHESEIAGWK